MSGPQATKEKTLPQQSPAPAQVQVNAQQMAQEQIMKKAAQKINDTIQKTPGLEKHQVSIIFENNVLVLKVSTTNESEINKEVAPEAIREAVLALSGEEFAVAGLALQTEKADSNELAKVLDNKISQLAIRNLIRDNKLTFEERTSEGSKGGEGTKSVEAIVSGYKREQRLAEEERIKSTYVLKEEATKAQKKAMEESQKREAGGASVQKVDDTLSVVIATKKGGEGAIFLHVNRELHKKIIEQFNKNIDEFMKNDNNKYVITKEDAKTKSGFYKDNGSIWVSFIHEDGKRKQECLRDKDGNIDYEVFKNTFHVLNNNLNESSIQGRLRKKNGYTKKDTDDIRKCFIKGIKDIEGYKEWTEPGKKEYEEKVKGFKLTDGFEFGIIKATGEYEKKKEEEDQGLNEIILNEMNKSSDFITDKQQQVFKQNNLSVIITEEDGKYKTYYVSTRKNYDPEEVKEDLSKSLTAIRKDAKTEEEKQKLNVLMLILTGDATSDMVEKLKNYDEAQTNTFFASYEKNLEGKYFNFHSRTLLDTSLEEMVSSALDKEEDSASAFDIIVFENDFEKEVEKLKKP